MEKQEIISYIKDVHFGYLATVGEDNLPRVRPISIQCVYNDNLYFFTFQHTRKVQEMNNNHQVEVVWSKLDEQSQVRISGKVMLEADQGITQQFIEDNPIVTKMLPPEARHLFQLYRLEPDKVEVAEGLVPYNHVEW